MQVEVTIKIKRAILLGAAALTCTEIEERKSRAEERIKALTESMYDDGARLFVAAGLKQRAENGTEEEIELTANELACIGEHIPTT